MKTEGEREFDYICPRLLRERKGEKYKKVRNEREKLSHHNKRDLDKDSVFSCKLIKHLFPMF